MSKRRRTASTDAKRPPEGQPWVWLTLDLVRSPAWRARSINCIRLVDFLVIEHMQHGGNENGNLPAPYTQLVAFGITRRLISAAIDEAEALGLIAVKRGGKKGDIFNEASRYRLTFYASPVRDKNGFTRWDPPTDEWKSYENKPHIGNRIAPTSGTTLAPTSGTANVATLWNPSTRPSSRRGTAIYI